MKYILGGHWEEAPPGWTALTQADQDLTAPLKWEDNSVEAILTEHVGEHLSMTDCILFFREAHRVLKPGGIIRTVAPFIDKLCEYRDGSALSRDYTKTSLSIYYPNEVIALKEIGIDFMEHGRSFLFDSLLKKHLHKHVWTTNLMYEVLKKIGFNQVYSGNIGHTAFDMSICLERRVRGISDEARETLVGSYDCESMYVEAKK